MSRYTLLQRVRQHGADSERHLGADPATADDSRCHSGLPETHSAGHQQPPDILTGRHAALLLHSRLLSIRHLQHRARHSQEQRAVYSHHIATGNYRAAPTNGTIQSLLSIFFAYLMTLFNCVCYADSSLQRAKLLLRLNSRIGLEGLRKNDKTLRIECKWLEIRTGGFSNTKQEC